MPPYENAIDIIGKIRFEAIKLIIYHEENLEVYRTPTHVVAIRRKTDSYGQMVPHFAMHQDAVSHIVNLDPSGCERALDRVAPASVGRDLAHCLALWCATNLALREDETGTTV